MNITFLSASKFKGLTDVQAQFMRSQGLLPIVVNDVFRQNFILSENDGRIKFRPERVQISYGGSGSGKSDFKATELLIKAMTQPYFRLLYSRKFAAQIRDSQFLLFKDLIKRYGLSEYFDVRESMDIRCLLNGNMMIAAGLDDGHRIRQRLDHRRRCRPGRARVGGRRSRFRIRVGVASGGAARRRGSARRSFPRGGIGGRACRWSAAIRAGAGVMVPRSAWSGVRRRCRLTRMAGIAASQGR